VRFFSLNEKDSQRLALHLTTMESLKWNNHIDDRDLGAVGGVWDWMALLID
jgi:hypothetical protein